MNDRHDDAPRSSDAKSHTSETEAAATPFRDPSHWKTGGEPMTAAQKSYLGTLATEAGENIDDLESLTKAQAAERIDALQHKTGRGA